MRRRKFSVPGQLSQENSAQASLSCCISVWALIAQADCSGACSQGTHKCWFRVGCDGQGSILQMYRVWSECLLSTCGLSLAPVGHAARGETF